MYFQRHKLRFPQPGSKPPSDEEFMASLGWHPPQWAGHEMFGWGRTPFDTALSRAANQPARIERVLVPEDPEQLEKKIKKEAQRLSRSSSRGSESTMDIVSKVVDEVGGAYYIPEDPSDVAGYELVVRQNEDTVNKLLDKPEVQNALRELHSSPHYSSNRTAWEHLTTGKKRILISNKFVIADLKNLKKDMGRGRTIADMVEDRRTENPLKLPEDMAGLTTGSSFLRFPRKLPRAGQLVKAQVNQTFVPEPESKPEPSPRKSDSDEELEDDKSECEVDEPKPEAKPIKPVEENAPQTKPFNTPADAMAETIKVLVHNKLGVTELKDSIKTAEARPADSVG